MKFLPTSQSHSRSVTVWIIAAILVISFLPYLKTAGYAFVNIDDFSYVQECDQVKKGLTLEGFKWSFSNVDYGAIWMPLTWLSYMLDVSVWGMRPGLMHLENAAFHALDAALLFVLLLTVLKNLAGSRSSSKSDDDSHMLAIAVVATLFWSLHPLRVEPVAWIASRKDVLSVFWELWAFIFWVKAVMAREVSPTVTNATMPVGSAAETSGNAQPTASSLQPTLYRFASLLCFACACLCKPTAMTFPILAGLLEFLLTRRVRWDYYRTPFIGALVVAWIAQYGQVVGGAAETLSKVPFYGRVMNAVAAFGVYCWKTLAPMRLAAVHMHQWPDMPHYLELGALICLIYGVTLIVLFWQTGACNLLFSELTAFIRNRVVASRLPSRVGFAYQSSEKTGRGLFVGLMWFLIAVAPMLGLSNFGFHSHADRFTYVPAIGFSLALATSLCFFGRRAIRFLVSFLGVVVCIWFMLTWHQVDIWRNDKTLFTRSLEIDPSKNYVAHRNLGLYYYGTEHDLPRAVHHFSTALALDREGARSCQLYYILALLENRDIVKAKDETHELGLWKDENVNREMRQRGDQIIVGSTRVFDTFLAYALAAHLEGDDELANQHLDYVFKRNPSCQEAHYIKGLMEYDAKHVEEAIKQWELCLDTTRVIIWPYLRKVVMDLRIRKEASSRASGGSL